MEFYVGTNKKELEKNLKLQGLPSDLQDKVKGVVTEYWYVFCDNIFCRPIQVFSFHIGTGNYPPICYKLPRYGTHESDVMLNLVGRLDKKL